MITNMRGHAVRTLHGHDDFGNNIYHQASPSPAPPSSMPPSTMINWEFPPLLNNRIPTETTTGAQTWWQYRNNGEASWIGKTPGGDKIQLDWDGLGLLKAISDTVGNTINARHDFTYAPSGLRIRDKRTGTARATPHDKRFAYTTGGALMSVYELSPSNTNTITGRRDIVYANGEAIAEIDQNNNIYELHNDYLGSPRYITSGGTGQIAGEQAFGPYGEQMTGTFNSGYRPITGYTGHINEDLTGLIYMRGRYYSPKWHRFINSDQGVDPNSINQFAYVNGMPFMATDPSGMREAKAFTYQKQPMPLTEMELNGLMLIAKAGALWELSVLTGISFGHYPTEKEIKDAFLKLYNQWAKEQRENGTDFQLFGIISGFYKAIGFNYPDCIDFSESLANYLNDKNPYPYFAWAEAMPSNPKKIHHYDVAIYMLNTSGNSVIIDRFDPYYASWWRGLIK
jgi:RHS repeat-associated protein